jgi:hypothetical protein
MKWLPAPALAFLVAALAWTSAGHPARYQQRSVGVADRARPLADAVRLTDRAESGGPPREEPAEAEARGDYLIAGRVVDGGGRAIANARVLLREGSG